MAPANTPFGGPQLPQFAANKKEHPERRPLVDVTQHYAASATRICIGVQGGCFSMDTSTTCLTTSCRQEAAFVLESGETVAAAAAKARMAAAKRHALRFAMR